MGVGGSRGVWIRESDSGGLHDGGGVGVGERDLGSWSPLGCNLGGLLHDGLWF